MEPILPDKVKVGAVVLAQIVAVPEAMEVEPATDAASTSIYVLDLSEGQSAPYLAVNL